jgi:serine/threonine-protein kinase
VVDLQGQGAFGTVYLAERVEPPTPGRVALKLALHPGDERFGREVELLRRVRHPSVPRLLDHGQWKSPAGLAYPYLAMEWVEGVPLYEWARDRAPSSRQVLQQLAVLARVLEAIHAVQGVHRDVKGDNVLVRPEDGRVFLVDFGSASYQGAAPLTSQVFPPGTSLYRSPEAYRHALRFGRKTSTPYAPGPPDDVFALGVTAYRLVTEEYPPSPNPMDEEAHRWLVDGTGASPARELNARCCPELSALISRMLAIRPEARGSAQELAEALEVAAREAGPDADAPLFARKAAPRSVTQLERTPRVLIAGLVTVLLWLAGTLLGNRESGQGTDDPSDAGAVAVGDSAAESSQVSIQPAASRSSVALEVPPKPLPGQTRPDASGRCPISTQVAIHGGCWWRLEVPLKDCPIGNYVYKGKCYAPAAPLLQPSTSGASESPDGG